MGARAEKEHYRSPFVGAQPGDPKRASAVENWLEVSLDKTATMLASNATELAMTIKVMPNSNS
jgi:hypothetical protein